MECVYVEVGDDDFVVGVVLDEWYDFVDDP